MRYYSAVLYFVLLTTASRTWPQSIKPAIDSVNVLFTKFMQANNDKSIVLTTNRNIFLAGEKIWFKAYVVNDNSGRLDVTSKNVFVDLVNDKDSTIEKLVLNNTTGNTNGAFNLPEMLPTGFYWIRCYTTAQLENDSTNIFLHPVYVLNKQLRDESAYSKQFEKDLSHHPQLSPSVHFYTERLTAIPGIISTGVMEIKDVRNNPLAVQGELVNSKDSLVTSFKTNSFGLARLTFIADPIEKYTAVFHINNQAFRYQLPAAGNKAIQLSVGSRTATTIKAFVTLEESVPADTHTTILAVHNDSLYYAAVGTGTYGLTIPTENFPGGTVRLLLFDAYQNLVSERKIYIPKENADLQVTVDKKQYAAREDVELHIQVTAINGNPLVSALNIAVEDKLLAQLSDSMEALMLPPTNDFLLNTWLNQHHTQYTADDVDLLMVTKGTILQPHVTASGKTMQDDDINQQLQNLTGKVINRKGIGIGDRIVTALAKNTHDFFMVVDTTNKDGRFSLSLPPGFDSLQLSLQVTDKHQMQINTDSITTDSFRYSKLATPVSLKQQFLISNINTLTLIQKYHIDTAIVFQGKGWLAPITVKTIKAEALNYDVTRRINPLSQIVTSDKFRYGGLDAIGNAVLMVAGVSLSFGDISIFGPSFDLGGHVGRPLIIMDGYEVPIEGSVLGFLNSLDPASIDFVEVLRGPEAAIYGVRGGSGVISVNTKHGLDRINYNKTSLRIVTPVTYHLCPAFNMPDYAKKEIRSSSNTDTRTTIYWNGNATTDANGTVNIHFYTADMATSYAITIAGLTTTGDPIYKRIVVDNTGFKK